MRSGTAALALLLLLGPCAAASAAGLIAHRAVYDLTLRETRKPNAIERVTGRMVYEFTGSACEGFTSKARQVTELVDPDGKTTLSDLRSTSWEDGAGKNYRFDSKTFSNSSLSKEIKGSAARRVDGGLDIALTKPQADTSGFAPPILFPTQHTEAIIGEAEKGAATLGASVFDGTSDPDKEYATLTVIGREIGSPPGDVLEKPATEGPLGASRRWPVRVSYFNGSEKAKSGESTPLYTMGFELYDNGVSRALRIDYGDFVLDGKLTKIEFLPAKPCPAN